MTVVDSAPRSISAHTSDARMTCGTCAPATGNRVRRHLRPASKVIPLTGASVTQTVHWTDLTGGKRTPNFTGESPNPALLTALAAWALPWNGTGSPQYTVDITVDNIKYITP